MPLLANPYIRNIMNEIMKCKCYVTFSDIPFITFCLLFAECRCLSDCLPCLSACQPPSDRIHFVKRPKARLTPPLPTSPSSVVACVKPDFPDVAKRKRCHYLQHRAGQCGLFLRQFCGLRSKLTHSLTAWAYVARHNSHEKPL